MLLEEGSMTSSLDERSPVRRHGSDIDTFEEKVPIRVVHGPCFITWARVRVQATPMQSLESVTPYPQVQANAGPIAVWQFLAGPKLKSSFLAVPGRSTMH